jgi:hypothetical protein
VKIKALVLKAVNPHFSPSGAGQLGTLKHKMMTIVQDAPPVCPKIPDPGEKCGLKKCAILKRDEDSEKLKDLCSFYL